MSRVSITSDEIVVDFTRTLEGSPLKSFGIIILEQTYIVPQLNGATKKTLLFDKYKLNLFYLQCTCPDFKNNIKKYPQRDIRRICKHLYYKIITELESEIDPLARILLENRFWMHETEVHKIKFEEQIIYLGFYNSEKSINVYKYTDKWRQYQYDLINKCWINDSMPYSKHHINRKLELFLIDYNPEIK